MIKLKDILKESFTTKYWGNRKFGDKLPTLEDYKNLKEGIDIDTAYNELHIALVNAKTALKQNGDKDALRAFLKWWDKLDQFYPPKD